MSEKKYNQSRPSIPINIKRQVQVHAKHRCQVCSETSSLDFHHIDNNRENNTFDNIILLCAVCHRRAHKGDIDRKSLNQYKNNIFITSVTSVTSERNSNKDEEVIKRIKELLPWKFIASLKSSSYASDFNYDTFFPFEYFLEECDNPDFCFTDTSKENNRKKIQGKINIVFDIIGKYREEPNPRMYIIGPKRYNLQENDPHNEFRDRVLENFNYALLDIYDLYYEICK